MTKHSMGRDTVRGHTGGKTSPDAFSEADLADEAHGNNRLQGNDQSSVRNERGAYPDRKPDLSDRQKDRPTGPAQPDKVDRPERTKR